jgi:hypothetical protein
MLVAAAMLAMSTGVANAQSTNRAHHAGAWGARAVGAAASVDRIDTTSPTLEPDGDRTALRAARASKARGITGTWRVSIPQSDAGLPPFNAYQTFNADGTFTEVSDLLTTQTESPAHGVWSGKKLDYQLTFELFVFDPATKEPVGRVRVRCNIRLSDDGDAFTASSVVDFIAPDGSVAEAVDSGPFTGTRVKVVPISGT